MLHSASYSDPTMKVVHGKNAPDRTDRGDDRPALYLYNDNDLYYYKSR